MSGRLLIRVDGRLRNGKPWAREFPSVGEVFDFAFLDDSSVLHLNSAGSR